MNTEQNTNQTPQTNGQVVNNTPNTQSTSQNVTNQNVTNQNVQTNSSNSIEMIEFSNDISESKGVLNDDTTTKPQDDFSDKTIGAVNKLINTTDYTSYFGKEEVQQYKVHAMLCYVPLVAFYFKYINKLGSKSKYLDYHVKEGVNLSLFWIVVVVISKVLYGMFTKKYLMSEETPMWVKFVSYALYCLAIVLTIVGIYRTNSGKSKDLPIIGKYKFLK